MKTSAKYITEQIVVNVIINFLIAFFIGRFTLAQLDSIPLWPIESAPLEPNMCGDILLGTFLLTFILTMIITAVTKHNIRKKLVDNSNITSNPWLNYLPKSFILRALFMGLLATLMIGLDVVLILFFMNIEQVNSGFYNIIHSTYAGILAGAVTYIAAKRALTE